VDDKLLAVLCAFSLGLSPILVKQGFARNGHVDSAVVIALTIAIPLNVLLLPIQGGLHWEAVNAQAFAGFAIGGLFGAGIGRRWLYVAIERIGPSPATAIKNAAPLLSTGFAILLFGEPVTTLHWIATIAIVGGVALVSWKPGRPFRLLDYGLLAAFGSALSYGVRPILVKFGLDAAAIPVTAALVGATTGLVYATVMSRPWRMRRAEVDLRALLAAPATPWFVSSGALQTLGIVFITAALSGSDVSVVYPITSSAPLVTVVLSWIFLRAHEEVTPRMVIGAATVVGGVILL
jgi:drug/metabolite transporter (DMT)-like permease